MKGLLCIGIVDAFSSNGETKHFCFIRKGSMMLYPTIDHKENCDCALVTSNDTIKQKCNKQDLVVGLLYYSWETYQYFPLTLEAVAFLKYGLYGTAIGDDFLNMYIRPAALVTLRGAIPDENVTQSEVHTSFMSICQYYPCSVIVFNAVDVFSNTINGYAFEVKQGACNNTVYNPERFTQILNTPFEFTEKYKSCEHTPFNVAIFTIAVSSGNAQIMTQILMFFMTMLIGMALYWIGYKTEFADEKFEEWHMERKKTKQNLKDKRIQLKSQPNKYSLTRSFSDFVGGDDDDDDNDHGKISSKQTQLTGLNDDGMGHDEGTTIRVISPKGSTALSNQTNNNNNWFFF